MKRTAIDFSDKLRLIVTATFLVLLGITTSDDVRAQQTDILWVEPSATIYSGSMSDGTKQVELMGAQGPHLVYADTVNHILFWMTDQDIRAVNLESGKRWIVTGNVPDPFPSMTADPSAQRLYWVRAELTRIESVSYDGSGRTTVLDEGDGLSYPMGIDFHTGNGKIYFQDDDVLYRSDTDGSNLESVDQPYDALTTLRIDPAEEKVYWTAYRDDLIKRKNLDGSGSEEVMEVSRPTGLSLDLANGTIYTANDSKIYQANLDGTEMEEAVGVEYGAFSDGIPSVAVDPERGMFWNQRPGFGENYIAAMTLDGSQSERFIRDYNPVDVVMDLDNGVAFWLDGSYDAIFKTDLAFSGVEIIADSASVSNLSTMALDRDKKRLFARFGDGIRMMEYDGTVLNVVGKPDNTMAALVADPGSEIVYWADNAGSSFANLKRAPYDGSDLDTLIEMNMNYPRGFAIDEDAEKLYWMAGSNFNGGSALKRANLDGTDADTLLTADDGLKEPYDMKIDVKNGKLYWSDAADSSFFKANLDGSGMAKLDVDPVKPLALAIPVTTTATDIADDDAKSLPEKVKLHANYPNPFNPATNISYELAEKSSVHLTVYDMLGRRVAQLVDGRVQAAGRYEIQFRASSLSSGMYLYRLEAGDVTLTRKMLLLK